MSHSYEQWVEDVASWTRQLVELRSLPEVEPVRELPARIRVIGYLSTRTTEESR